MRLILAFLVLAASLSFAQSYCEDSYDQCITNCCDSCGSTLSTDSNGDLVCDVGTESEPDQACINACLPCSSQYQQCISGSSDDSGFEGSYSTSCCGSAAILGGVLGLAFIRKK